MTSLAKQLNALRQEIQLPQKSIPSLLFSPDDAFHVESSLIYNLSYQSFQELLKTDQTLHKLDYLWENKKVVRDLDTEEAYISTNEQLKQTLLLLSPHFLNEHAIKIIEHLIRAYQIHVAIPEYILLALFPYFQSQIFTRLAQLINFSLLGSQFQFMEPYISKGYCVPHKEVVSSINKDTLLLHQLIDILQQSSSTNIYIHANLISALCVDSLSLSSSPNLIRIISNYAINNLESPTECVANSALLVLNRLFVDSRISKDFIDKASTQLFNKIKSSDAPHILCESLLIMVQNRWQDIELSAEELDLLLKDNFKRIFSLLRKKSIDTHSIVMLLLSSSLKLQINDASIISKIFNFEPLQHNSLIEIANYLFLNIANPMTKDCLELLAKVYSSKIIDVFRIALPKLGARQESILKSLESTDLILFLKVNQPNQENEIAHYVKSFSSLSEGASSLMLSYAFEVIEKKNLPPKSMEELLCLDYHNKEEHAKLILTWLAWNLDSTYYPKKMKKHCITKLSSLKINESNAHIINILELRNCIQAEEFGILKLVSSVPSTFGCGSQSFEQNIITNVDLLWSEMFVCLIEICSKDYQSVLILNKWLEILLGGIKSKYEFFLEEILDKINNLIVAITTCKHNYEGITELLCSHLPLIQRKSISEAQRNKILSIMSTIYSLIIAKPSKIKISAFIAMVIKQFGADPSILLMLFTNMLKTNIEVSNLILLLARIIKENSKLDIEHVKLLTLVFATKYSQSHKKEIEVLVKVILQIKIGDEYTAIFKSIAENIECNILSSLDTLLQNSPEISEKLMSDISKQPNHQFYIQHIPMIIVSAISSIPAPTDYIKKLISKNDKSLLEFIIQLFAVAKWDNGSIEQVIEVINLQTSNATLLVKLIESIKAKNQSLAKSVLIKYYINNGAKGCNSIIYVELLSLIKELGIKSTNIESAIAQIEISNHVFVRMLELIMICGVSASIKLIKLIDSSIDRLCDNKDDVELYVVEMLCDVIMMLYNSNVKHRDVIETSISPHLFKLYEKKANIIEHTQVYDPKCEADLQSCYLLCKLLGSINHYLSGKEIIRPCALMVKLNSVNSQQYQKMINEVIKSIQNMTQSQSESIINSYCSEFENLKQHLFKLDSSVLEFTSCLQNINHSAVILLCVFFMRQASSNLNDLYTTISSKMHAIPAYDFAYLLIYNNGNALQLLSALLEFSNTGMPLKLGNFVNGVLFYWYLIKKGNLSHCLAADNYKQCYEALYTLYKFKEQVNSYSFIAKKQSIKKLIIYALKNTISIMEQAIPLELYQNIHNYMITNVKHYEKLYSNKMLKSMLHKYEQSTVFKYSTEIFETVFTNSLALLKSVTEVRADISFICFNIQLLGTMLCHDHLAALVKLSKELQSMVESNSTELIICGISFYSKLLPMFKQESLPILHDALDKVIDICHNSKPDSSTHISLITQSVSLFNICLENISDFISPKIKGFMAIIINNYTAFSEEDILGIASSIASIEQSKSIFSSINSVFNSIADKTYSKISKLIIFFKEAISQVAKGYLQTHINSLIGLCINFLDSSTHYEEQKENYDAIANDEHTFNICKAITSLFLKLNEQQLSVIISKFVSWCLIDNNILDYQISASYEQLKELFTNHNHIFIPLLLDSGNELLATISKTDYQPQKRASTDNVEQPEEEYHTICKIIAALTSVFNNNPNSLIQHEDIILIITFLCKAIPLNCIPAAYDIANKHLSPCLAAAADSITTDTILKQLFHSVLQNVRNKDSKVRIGALDCILMVVDKIAERSLPLVNDILPYLTECFEDKVSAVEAKAKEVIKKFEAMTGESIKDYIK